VTAPRVANLSDEELVKEATALDAAILPPTQFTELASEPPLTAWEKSFIAGIQTFWIRQGGLTWKQRRSLRAILSKVNAFNERRAGLQEVRREVISR
jgi:hypothetical protein